MKNIITFFFVVQINIPIGMHSDLPVSISLLANHGSDMFLLHVAQELYDTLKEQASIDVIHWKEVLHFLFIQGGLRSMGHWLQGNRKILEKQHMSHCQIFSNMTTCSFAKPWSSPQYLLSCLKCTTCFVNGFFIIISCFGIQGFNEHVGSLHWSNAMV